MPYITPQDIPEERDCRALSIPASTEWLALFGGALTSFLYPYNWEQTTGISIADTIDEMSVIIAGFYDGCADGGCILPGGQSPIRVGLDGHVEQLIDDVWTDPTGDYAIPPIPAREEGTAPDQICLAARNAVNVLEELYEQVTDSFDAELDVDEAISALVIFIGTLPFMVAFAPIAASILIFLTPVFAAFYALMEFLTSDLWDAKFSENLTCILIDCANNDAGVVTFDWDCFNQALEDQVNLFVLNETQLRLFLQLGYLLMVIGGVDALNAAGSSTAITDDDCDFCEQTSFCIEIFSPVDGLDPIDNCAGAPNTWFNQFQVPLNVLGSSGAYQIDRLEMDVQYTGSGFPLGYIFVGWSNLNCTYVHQTQVGDSGAGLVQYELEPVDCYTEVARIFFGAACSNNESNSAGNILQIKRVKIVGHSLTSLPDNLSAFADYLCS